MGSTYYITGVQIGMIIGALDSSNVNSIIRSFVYETDKKTN